MIVINCTVSVLFKDSFLSEQDFLKRIRLARFRSSRIPSPAQRVELEPNRWQKVWRDGGLGRIQERLG